MTPDALGPFSIDRAFRAVELARGRLLRVARALETASIPYAVCGGHAVAVWVSRVDPAAVRNTPDVDLLVRREDLAATQSAMAAAGFRYHNDTFLANPNGTMRGGVHLIFANERVRPGEALANPDVTESEPGGAFRVLQLRPLVGIKLTAYRDKDRMHLRDMIDVGLIDATWGDHYPPALGGRLQALIDTPGG